MRVLVGVLAMAVVLTGGCRDERADGAGPDRSTSTAPPVTTAPGPTTTTTLLPAAPQPTGEGAVEALLGAWRAGDRPGALSVATPAAVDTLFAIAPERGQARGCNTGGANVNISCVYRLDAGELQVRAVPTPDGGGYVVDFVILGS